MDEERKPGRAKWMISRVAWVLVPAVIISGAYIIYMFHWTTHYVDLEQAHLELQLEQSTLEDLFRRKVEEHHEFAEAVGYGAQDDEAEILGELQATVLQDLELFNKELELPLPEKDLNLRNLTLELLRRKQLSELRAKEALLTTDTLEERHASENKDKDLQALIYVQQIDRLKKRINELEGR